MPRAPWAATLIMVFSLLANLLVARLRPRKYVFLAGHHTLWRLCSRRCWARRGCRVGVLIGGLGKVPTASPAALGAAVMAVFAVLLGVASAAQGRRAATARSAAA